VPLPPDVDAGGLVAALVARIGAFLRDAPSAPPVAAVSLAFQGVIDRSGQRLVWSPIVAPRGVALSAPLAEALGVPVVALNDCSAMAEALLWGKAAPGPDFAVILLGSGVGMGLALGGQVFEGRGLSALEFGHTTHLPGGRRCRCGRRGCIEAYVADYALERTAEAPGVGCLGIAKRAADGDPAAGAALAEAGMALGYGVARVFALFGPLPLVLAGPGAACFPAMEAAFRVSLTDGLAAELSAEPQITLIERADALALAGAAHHARGLLDAAFAHRTPATLEVVP
jgi:predicted NBD/HSP70 family sugar kinase